MLGKEQKNSPEIFSVSQLNKNAKFSLEKKFNDVWVKGEISEFTNYRQSGHWYFTLKDENSSISCVMFKFKNSYLKNIPEIGDEIILKGKLSLFEAQGRYQFIAESLEYSGEGDLLKAFENLKNKLLKEGLFDKSFKKEIPKLPMHIGIVTSPSGAVIQDIKNVLERRAPLSRLTLAPSLVQGDKAESEIINALNMLREFNKIEKLDLIIIARGGGSLEDLWCFNSELIAREIYTLEIPVISAVGHETDFTICDLVSDLRAPTPSAAAEISSQAHSQIIDKIEILEKAISTLVKNYLETVGENLSNASNVLKKINFNLDQKIFKIDESFNKIVSLQKEKFSSKRLNLINKRTSLRDKNPLIKLSNQKADLKSKKLIFKNAFNNILSNKKVSFDTFSLKLQAFSPLSVLSRGYTVSTKEDELLDNTKLTKGDEILTRTQRNIISSKITKIDEIK
jgi:exodeoxyribonuclease VII large subunit